MAAEREYAEALYSIASEGNNQKDYLDALKLVDGIFSENPEYIDMLESPAVDKEQKWDALLDAFKGEVPAFVMSYIGLMSDKGQIRRFHDSVKMFEEFYKEENNIESAVIESATELTDEQKEKLVKKLEDMKNCTIEAEFRTVPELLGGVKVLLENEVIDGSVKHKLAELKENMNR